MPFVTLSRGPVHYTETGEGPPLLLLHANPGDSRDFAAVAPALARRHRVLALDWPGYGQSPLPGAPEAATVLLFSDTLREFGEVLGLPPVGLVGNSLGGNAAARLAATAPELVRALVLVAPGGFTPHDMVSRAFCRLQGSTWALSPRRFAGLYLKKRTPTVEAMLARAATEQAEPQRLALNRALWRSFATPDNDLRALARGIQAPTLLVFGQRDPAIPPGKDGREAARAIPGAETVVLPCGHAPFAEMPDAFLEQVEPFLARQAAAGTGGDGRTPGGPGAR